MKHISKILAVSGLSASLALGGCATTTGGTTSTTTSISDTIAQIQNAAVTACAFLPTAATVANIIGTLAGVGTETNLAGNVAAQICAAVAPPKSAKLKAGVPTVNGVVIHGKFVS